MSMHSYPIPRSRWRFHGLLLVISLLSAAAYTPSAYGQGNRSYVWVDSNAPRTTVYLDSTRLGTGGPSLWSIQPGSHQISAGPAGIYSWSFEHQQARIDVLPGDTARVTFEFPYAYSITSRPPGANVFLVNVDGRKQLGVTPLTYTSDRPLSGTLVVDKMAYDSVHVAPGRELWNSYRLKLQGAGGSGAERHVGLPRRPKEHPWLTYAGAGLAVAAGAAAVYFQRRANHLRASDNPHVRLRSDRFERLSTGSLVVTQVGVGLLAFQLIWR